MRIEISKATKRFGKVHALRGVDLVVPEGRRVALGGPNGWGKTSPLESLLFVSGAIGRKGRVAERNTVGDASAEARERPVSTEISVASFQHAGYDFTVLDCPGSVEFTQEARQALITDQQVR